MPATPLHLFTSKNSTWRLNVSYRTTTPRAKNKLHIPVTGNSTTGPGISKKMGSVWQPKKASEVKLLCCCQYYLTQKNLHWFLGHWSHEPTIFQPTFKSHLLLQWLTCHKEKNALHFFKQATYALFSTNSSQNKCVHLCVCKSFKFQSTVVLILVRNFRLPSDNIKLCCLEWYKLGTIITNSICNVSPFL